LGQSQVLAYLIPMSEKHQITLMSYEREDDLSNEAQIEALEKKLAHAGIKWLRMKYHKRPGGVATLWDIGCGIIRAGSLAWREPFDIVHCRSYVPSVIGIFLKKMFGVSYLFDMRGFWVDERVDGGLWKREGMAYRVGKWFEKKFFTSADAVVSLTHAGIQEIKKIDYLQGKVPECFMIPTCTDIDRMIYREVGKKADSLTIGYVGAAGTWYLFEETVKCFKILRELCPDVRFLIVNRHEHSSIKELLAKWEIPDDCVELTSAAYDVVPEMIAQMDATIFFIKPVFSKTASAPTKLGEFLASGVPCLVNSGVGDMEQIVVESKTGVCVSAFDDASLREGVQELLLLLQDREVSKRCRDKAEEVFSLQAGIKSYLQIYQTLEERRR